MECPDYRQLLTEAKGMAMTKEYPVYAIDPHNWEQMEALGTKEKFWITHQGKLSLIKFGRANTGENWAEKIACELCSLLKIPHAHYELITYRNKQGTISPSILEEGDVLIHGHELLNKSQGNNGETKTYLQKEHTFSRMMAAILVFIDYDLKLNKIKDHKEGWHMMAGYLMLDAWIGNTDRHSMNWGIIKNKNNTYRLAPTFDHASCLGRELSDIKRSGILNPKDNRQTLSAYADKARSALTNIQSDVKAMPTLDAFIKISRFVPASAQYWQRQLEQITELQINSILQSIPDNFISNEARKFALNLLMYNSKRILNVKVKT